MNVIEKNSDLTKFCFSNTPLHDFNELRKYDEINAMWGVKQHPTYHPEVFLELHVGYVIVAMDRLCKEANIIGDRRIQYMLSALYHDISKPETTKWNEKKQKLTSYGHDLIGAKKVPIYLKDVFSQEIIDKVANTTKLHMAHSRKESDWSQKSIKKFASEMKYITGEDLLFMMKADNEGRPPLNKPLPQYLLDVINKIDFYLTK